MKKIVICSAARTPIGSFGGAFKNFSAVQLGIVAAKAAMERAHVKPEQIDEVFIGNVLGAGLGQNVSRQIALGAGVPVEVPAMTINIVCGSGLRAVSLAAQSIQTGNSTICLCGGTENMSMAPYLSQGTRWGARMGPSTMMDYMVHDGLWDIFNDYHMGVTAENVAAQYHLTREEMDEFSVRSQNRAEAAQKAGKFDKEVVPVVIHGRKGDTVVDKDEYIKYGCTMAGVAKLKPAFKKDGLVTAASSSGINDGAAMLVITTEEKAKELGLPIMATIISHGTAGVNPNVMGLGPIPSSRIALKRAGWTIDDVDYIEANEAFAAQSLAVVRDLKLPAEKTNIWGGAIALGHPIGCSGARILVTLLYVMQDNHAHKGLATLCIGGGMGTAVCVEM